MGRIEIQAQVTTKIEPGHVFTAFHFPEMQHEPAGRRLGRRQHVVPRVQGVAVDVRPIGEQPALTPALVGSED